MSKVLVTGGAGFIGSHLCRNLLDLGQEVVVVDDLSGGFQDNIDARCLFVKADVSDPGAMADLFKSHHFEYVFHLAAYAAEGLSHFIKRFNYMNNLVGTVNLINESVKQEVKCFLFTSSIAVYGENKLPMREEYVPRPEDPYGVAKYAAELELKVTQTMFGLNFIVFRPHNVYGEYQNIGDKYRNVLGIFMNQIMKEEPMTLFGDGSQTRAFSYVGDVTPIMAKSVLEPKAYNHIFNIGGDQVYSIVQLAEIVSRAMGVKAEIRRVEERREVKHAYCDHSKLRDMFGPVPVTPLETGVARMAAWARKTGPRQSQPFRNIEIKKGLPPVWA